MTNLYKNLSFLVLLMSLGCSSEGVKPVDPGLQRGGGNNPDADVVRPADVIVKVENPDTQPVQPDTQLKPDILIQKEDLGTIQQPDAMVKNDSNVIVSSDTITKTINRCIEAPGDGIFKENWPDMSNGQCVDVPFYGPDGSFVVMDCPKMKSIGSCDSSVFVRCGLCKVTCGRC